MAAVRQLAERMRVDGVKSRRIRTLYQTAYAQFSDAAERLVLAENGLELLDERDWAAVQYDQLAGADLPAAVLVEGRRLRLEQHL